MNNQDVGLDRLFASAREQAPEYTFDETKKQFLSSVVLAAGGVLATKGIISLFTKKWIIMMTIATMATSAAVVATTYSFSENEEPIHEAAPILTEWNEKQEEEPLIVEEEPIQEPIEETKLVFQTDGITETDEVEEVVRLKSSEIAKVPLFEDRLWYFTGPHCNDQAVVIDLQYPPDSLKENKEGLQVRRYIVTQETTKEELEQIKAEAEKVGIKFSYTADFEDGKLSELSVSMHLKYKDGGDKGDMSYTMTADKIKKKDEIEIGWMENDKNQARRLGTKGNGCGTSHSGCNTHSHSGSQSNCHSGNHSHSDTHSHSHSHSDSLYNSAFQEFEMAMEEFQFSMHQFQENMQNGMNDFNFNMEQDSAGTYAFSISCGDYFNTFDFEFPEIPEVPEFDEELLEELEQKLEELKEKLDVIEEELEELEEENDVDVDVDADIDEK